MKRILICLPDFRQGGIPRCLQSLLYAIDSTYYQIDVLCLHPYGPYRGEMPNCTLMHEDYVVSQLMVHTKKISVTDSAQHILALIFKIIRRLRQRVFHKDWLLERLSQMGQKLEKQATYDVAIAYAEGYSAVVVQHMRCRNKMVWIHNDYAFEGAREGALMTNFAAFNRICCVSNATRQSFIQFNPQIADKTTVIYNLINDVLILKQANEEIEDSRFVHDTFTIVSVGRVCWQKNYQAIPPIAKVLKKKKLSFKWYIIGGGSEAETHELLQVIACEQVENEVICLGNCNNPYAYMKQADLFVLTSNYESYPTVINEAKVVGLPIVANTIPPVYEMLNDLPSATIVELEEMASVIGAAIERGKRVYSGNVMIAQHNEKVLDRFYVLCEGV